MKVVKKIILTILTILFVLVLTFNIYNLVSLKILKKDLATINGYGILEVVSGSMEPTIHVGDIIIINTKEKTYKVNDIVTFYDENDAFVTHKIIELNDGLMITKGDNNPSPDKEMSTDKIVGKYVGKINFGGAIIESLKSPFTMVMILVIGFLVCVLISTDKEGNPILTEDEKEFEEFLKLKENSVIENKKKKEELKEIKNTNDKKEEVSKAEEIKKVSTKNANKSTTTKKNAKSTNNKKESTKKNTTKKASTTTKKSSKK